MFLAGGLALTAALDPRAADPLKVKTALFVLSAALLAALGLARLAWGPRPELPPRRLLAVAGALLACLAASALFSPSRPLAWRGWLAWALVALEFLALFDALAEPWFRGLVTDGLLVCLALAEAWGLLQGLGLDPTSWQSVVGRDFGGRLAACFGNPNFFAGFLVLLLPLAGWRALLGRSWRRGAGALLLAGAVPLAFHTGCKAAVTAMALQFLTLGHLAWHSDLERPRRRRFLAWWAGSGLLLALASLLLLAPVLRQRFARAFSAQNPSVTFRLTTWAGAWRMAEARPLLGFGPNTFSARYPAFRPAVAMKTQEQHSYEVTAPENWPLQVLDEGGLAGLALFCLLLWMLLKPLWDSSHRLGTRPGEAGPAAFLLLGLGGSLAMNLAAWDLFLPGTWWFFTALLALAARAGLPAPARPRGRGLPAPAGGALALALVLAALCAGARAWNWARSSSLLWRAEAVSRSGAFDRALPLYHASLDLDPLNLEARYFLGCDLLDRGGREDLVRAGECFQKLSALAPDYVLLRDKEAGLEWKEGDTAGAEANWRAMMALDPYYLPAPQELARMLWGQGRTQEAEEVLRRALADNPGDSGLEQNLGVLLAGEGKEGQALALYRGILEQDPADRGARYNMAVILWRTGRKSEARAQTRALLKLHPGDPGGEALAKKLGL